MRTDILPSMRRPRVMAGALVGSLVAIGTAISLTAGAGSVWRDLGLAILSGGIVGGALVTVESLLAAAADRRSAAASLRMMLSTTADLNGIDLSEQQLTELYLPGRAMVAAELSNADLSGTKLPFADLRFAQLQGANLRGADLRGSTLVGADLTGADLRDALLDDADISDATFEADDPTLSNADSKLRAADLTNARFRDARAQRTDFGTAKVTSAVFDNVYLEGADLSAVVGGLSLVGAVQYDELTRWPPGFERPESVQVTQESISDMDLAAYLAYRHQREATPTQGPDAEL